jgi:hypothetical protein
MHMSRPLFGLFLVAAVGCGGAPADGKVRVWGTVTLDGSPLADGAILFDGERKLPSEMGRIRNGKYEVRVAPGARVVRITSERVSPDKRDKLDMPLVEQVLPARYNSASELRVTVNADKEEKFDLRSQ